MPRTARPPLLVAWVVLVVGAAAAWLLWQGRRGSEAAYEAVQSPCTPLPDTPEARGEATARAGETWSDARGPTGHPEGIPRPEIAGRVLDQEGRPVAGVWLGLAFDDGLPGDDGTSLESEEDGTFVFDELAERVYRILVVGPDTPPTRRVISGLRPGRRDVRIRVPGAWHHAEVQEGWRAPIRVLAPDGTPVTKWTYTEALPTGPGASIDGWVEPEPGEPGLVWFSGAGPAAIVVHGCVDASYEPLPYAPVFVPGLAPEAPVREVRLRPAETITGRVDPPRAGIPVVVRYLARTDGTAEDPRLAGDDVYPGAIRTGWSETDAEGRFVLTDLPPGRVRLIALPRGVDPMRAPLDAGRTVEAGAADARLRVTACARIQGVLDVAAAAGAEELQYVVRVTRREGDTRRLVWEVTWTPEDLATLEGRFESPPLPEDAEYDVEVWARGALPGHAGMQVPFAVRRIERVRPGGAEVFVVLQRLPSLAVEIQGDDGTPVSRALELLALPAEAPPLLQAALLCGDEALLESDLFEPDPAQAGPWEVVEPRYATWDGARQHVFPALRPTDHVLWTRGPDGVAQRIEPPARPGGDPATLVLRRGAGRIHGRVTPSAGGMPVGFVIEARGVEAPQHVLAVSTVRHDGWFELRGLPAGEVQLHGHDLRDPASRRVLFVPRLPVDGPAVAIGLVEGGVLGGVVLDGRGGAAAGARIRLEAVDGAERRSATTDSDGRFVLGGLVHAAFTLRVTLPDGRSRETRVAAGAEDLRLLVE